MIRQVWVFSVALFLVGLPDAHAEQQKIAVLPTILEDSAKGQVPALIDEILLTSVQSAGDFEVIGQDDINALIGFEQQKEMLGCDAISCMASIGGALGVERLVSFKIARLESDWVVTSKLINIRDTKVESRSSDFVSGDAKALLEAMPSIVRKLFRGGGEAAIAEKKPAAVGGGQSLPSAATTVTKYDASFGKDTRKTAMIMALSGFALAAAGIIFTSLKAETLLDDGETKTWGDGSSTTREGDQCVNSWESERVDLSECIVPNYGYMIGGAVVYGVGLALGGIGAGRYLDGKAQAYANSDNAKGFHDLTWLGWALGIAGIVGPALFAAIEIEAAAWITGIGGTIGSSAVFAMTMASSSSYTVNSVGQRRPMAKLIMLEDHGHYRPGVGFAFDF